MQRLESVQIEKLARPDITLNMTTTEEFKVCDDIAQELLARFGSADEIPSFVARDMVMEAFGLVRDEKGWLPLAVLELTSLVFEVAHGS